MEKLNDILKENVTKLVYLLMHYVFDDARFHKLCNTIQNKITRLKVT